jgi:hypothetical protein
MVNRENAAAVIIAPCSRCTAGTAFRFLADSMLVYLVFGRVPLTRSSRGHPGGRDGGRGAVRHSLQRAGSPSSALCTSQTRWVASREGASLKAIAGMASASTALGVDRLIGTERLVAPIVCSGRIAEATRTIDSRWRLFPTRSIL